MHLAVVIAALSMVFVLVQDFAKKGIENTQQNWITYQPNIMSVCLVLSNMIFIIATIVDARKSHSNWYDDAVVMGIMASVMIGMLVDIRS